MPVILMLTGFVFGVPVGIGIGFAIVRYALDTE